MAEVWIVHGVKTEFKKVKVEQSHYRPGQAQRVLRKLMFPDYMVGCQPYAPAAFTPQEIFLVLISVRG